MAEDARGRALLPLRRAVRGRADNRRLSSFAGRHHGEAGPAAERRPTRAYAASTRRSLGWVSRASTAASRRTRSSGAPGFLVTRCCARSSPSLPDAQRGGLLTGVVSPAGRRQHHRPEHGHARQADAQSAEHGQVEARPLRRLEPSALEHAGERGRRVLMPRVLEIVAAAEQPVARAARRVDSFAG